MPNYYNEIDKNAAAWLRELVSAGEIPSGDVDERDIRDIRPDELRRYTQCHFFAGIGGWPLAIKLAGWPQDRPVWTGSCPCQPFSAAGAGVGFADERHLWPHWFHLIGECAPASVLGEQVASKDGLGWLDLVSADLEGAGYAFGVSDLCAAGIGSPHIRQRLYFGAQRLVNTFGTGLERYRWHGDISGQPGWIGEDSPRSASSASCIGGLADALGSTGRSYALDGFWTDADWLFCRDGKWRPVEPGSQPLVNGLPGRVGLLRGYGNAIVPPLAAAFIQAFEAARCAPAVAERSLEDLW